MTAVEWLIQEHFGGIENCTPHFRNKIEQAKEIEKEQRDKLWTNEEVFDMLYKTDKFLMIDLREYWKTIEK